MNTQIQPYLPDYVSLYYVDYRDDLCEHKELLQKSLSSNSLNPIQEEVFDWWDYPEGEYLKEIRQKMERDELEELYEENENEIRDWLCEKDTSTPVEDLLHNTGSISMFYSLGLEIDGWHSAFMCAPWRNGSYAQDAHKIRRKLGIEKNSPDAKLIDSIVQNASGGGELRIYFANGLTSVLSNEPDDDFKQIHFKGKFAVALYNASEGSGDFEYITIDRTFVFTRDNLYTSESDKYSLENCFGMCGDWLDKSASPIFSMELPQRASKTAKSKNAERMIQEAKYNEVFKAGGCTFGDMDYRRHRDVYYENNVPCGSHCPHCGTFWID
jgi:hypothetical protein